jgi:hypothetical protein
VKALYDYVNNTHFALRLMKALNEKSNSEAEIKNCHYKETKDITAPFQ